MQETMKRQVCLVTGAIPGIGRTIAEGLAKLGDTLIITIRNQQKREKLLRITQEKTKSSFPELIVADFAFRDNIQQLLNLRKAGDKS